MLQNHNNSGHQPPPQPPPPPPPDPIRDFEVLEARISKECRGIACCPNCGKDSLQSKGGAGALDSRGIRRIQMRCSACMKACRLEAALQKAGSAGLELLNQLKSAHSAVPTTRAAAAKSVLSQTRTILKPTAKRPRAEAAVLEEEEVFEVEKEKMAATPNVAIGPSTTSRTPNEELREACARADAAEKQQLAMAAQIATLVKQISELQKQIQKLLEKQNGPPQFTFSHGGQKSASKSVSFSFDKSFESAAKSPTAPLPVGILPTQQDFDFSASTAASPSVWRDSEAGSFRTVGNLKKPTKNSKPNSGSGVNGRHVPGWDEEEEYVPHSVRRQAQAAQLLKPLSSGKTQSHSLKEGSTGAIQTLMSVSPSSASKVSYAAIASRQTQKMLKQRQIAVQKMLAPTHEPAQFSVIRIGINDSRPLRNIRGTARDKLVKEVANSLGISKFTILASTIGNSILEFYVPVGTVDVVMTKLKDANVQILENFDPFKLPTHGRQSAESCKVSTVNRLAHLCLVAKLVNLQDTILKGAPADVKSAVLDKFRIVTKNPQATLGRQSSHSREAVVVLVDDDMDEAALASSC